MDPIFKQSISFAVTSTITATFADFYTKYDNNIWLLYKIFEKVLLAKSSILLLYLLLGHDNLFLNTQVPASEDADGNSKNTSTANLIFKIFQKR